MKKEYKSKAQYLAVLGAIAAPLCIASMNASAADVPVYLNQAATSINVTVTDRTNFVLPANTNTATVSSITVTNNLTSVPVVVSNIQATAQAGYNLEAYSTDFSIYDAGSRHFGIAYTGDNASGDDISGAGYATEEEIAAEGNHVFTFAGKSSAYPTAVTAQSNTQIANIILTIAMKPFVSYNEPTWQWKYSGGEWVTTATFVSKDGSDTRKIRATVSDSETPGQWIYTATVMFNGTEYRDIRTYDKDFNVTCDGGTATTFKYGATAFCTSSSPKIWYKNGVLAESEPTTMFYFTVTEDLVITSADPE